MPHMMGCRGAGHGELKFTDCRIDKKYLLGKEGQGLEIAMHSLSVSRAHIAASNLGMAQRMLELSLQYAADRVTFGKPIGTRQAIRCKIADMSMMVHALRFEDCKYGPVERLYRDCRAMWLEEGAPTVQRITISRNTIKHGAHIEYVI